MNIRDCMHLLTGKAFDLPPAAGHVSYLLRTWINKIIKMEVDLKKIQSVPFLFKLDCIVRTQV